MLTLVTSVTLALTRPSEFKIMPGHKIQNMYTSPLPHTYTNVSSLPDNFSWGDKGGKSYLTKSLNQHIPQYCGSCWAHGAASSLADRVKIARGAAGVDINLAIQYILNCGGDVAGSCHGGSATGVFEFLKTGSNEWPYDTCLQYQACSSESTEGACGSGDWTCTGLNTCRTCSTFASNGGHCSALDFYPNVSIAEYGQVSGVDKIKAEIYHRGPVACGVDAVPLLNYTGGILSNKGGMIDHIISVVGWGKDAETGQKYWQVRNSWGEFWGELGYARVEFGSISIEKECSWATPGHWTEANFPCDEDGGNCVVTKHYVDPSVHHAH